MFHLLSPPFAPPQTVIFCRFLRVGRKQKIPISLGNQDFTVFYFSSKWCHQESNRGHKDFQSFALPTELWHLYALSFSIVGAKVVLFFYLQIISRKKCGFPAKKCQMFYKIRGFYGLNGDGLVFLPKTRFVSGCGNPWILWFLPDLSEKLSRDSIVRSVACMDRNAEPYNPRV